MGSGSEAEGNPAIAEDTVDLGERLDPVRTLLRRTAAGDRRAASSLVDVLAPRIHGLAVHVIGSSSRAEELTVEVLRSCLRDAGDLAASGLPGEAAVLDRARRAVVATNPTGDVRSLAGPDPVPDRTSDRREIEVLRVLLELPPEQRALAESAAQGRFRPIASTRREAAAALAEMLDALVPLGDPQDPQVRGLSALDALALAGPEERLHLRELTRSAEAAGVHRHAIEAAARLTVLTAIPPSRTLLPAVLEGFGAPPPQGTPAPRPAAERAAAAEVEPAYSGNYATPVLGTDSQRRMVGPPAMTGGARSGAAGGSPAAEPARPASPAPPDPVEGPIAPGGASAPAFAFRAADEKGLTRRRRRRERRWERAEGRSRGGAVPWLSRGLAALSLICALVLGLLLLDAHRRLEAAEEFAAAWAELSTSPGALLVPGASDNGTWQAVLGEDGSAVRAEGVTAAEDEVFELWAETDGEPTSLGVLDISRDGEVAFTSDLTGERLFVTREISPGSESGSPSTKVLANLDPRSEGHSPDEDG